MLRAMDATGWSELIQLVRDAGTIGLLTIAIVGGIRGWYVWRREFDRLVADLAAMVADRDQWKSLALELLRQNDRATSIAEKAVATK